MAAFRTTLAIVALAAAFAGSAPVRACGEGIVYMGDGLRHQGYLAPHPATVLIYAGDAVPTRERIAVYRGLARAGHRLTIVTDARDFALVMQQRRYDVVIADYAATTVVDRVLAALTAKPSLLPVVARQLRNTPEVRGRFAQMLIDGASLGQYLRQINTLMTR